MESRFCTEIDGSTEYSGPSEYQVRLKNGLDDILSFSGVYRNYCVCIVDAVDSTKITATLPKEKICQYYGTFLNSMTLIASKFGAVVVKNVGDSLLYYFPETSQMSNKFSFRNAIECGIAMIDSHSIINSKMHEKGLPSVSYRISADYGLVMTARSEHFPSGDIFGSSVNICAKINSKAVPNSMVIGGDLYQIVKSFEGFRFKLITGYSTGLKLDYPVYAISRNAL